MMRGKEENEWTNMKMWRKQSTVFKRKNGKENLGLLRKNYFYISNGLIEENSFYRSTKRICRALTES